MSRKTEWQDPHAQREAANYENPIPSRELILDTITRHVQQQPTAPWLSEHFLLVDDETQFALQKRLGAMVRDGQLAVDRRGIYRPLRDDECLSGRVQGHADGFGFLLRSDGPDVLLNSRQMRLVFDGDTALVRVVGYDHKGRPEGRVVRVLERRVSRMVGRYFEEDGQPFVVPDNPRITQEIALTGDLQGAQIGQFVEVRIVEWPTHRSIAVAEITAVLGDYMAPGMEIEIALRNFDIPHVWPAAVETEIASLSPEVAEADKSGRVDLRQLPLVTIDGEDAKDFDDAVYAEKRPGGGYRLVVAIADVSHYVRPGTALDEEGRNRGNSVYFPGFVVPMLPEILSNGLCSLKPQVDRLCMVCDLTVSRLGRVTGYRFYEAVMHSQARLTYTQVSALLEQPESEAGQAVATTWPHLVKPLHTLHGLFQLLRSVREQRGALDFDGQETYFVFNDDKKIERILPRTRNQAHMLIEECMLAANVCAAAFVQERGLPALYRNHEGPKNEKLQKLQSYLAMLGIPFAATDPQPADFQQVLTRIAERPDAPIIETMLLRSMAQAVYSPENLGHFGLAYEAYGHFTSPIRRYPDLLLHRVIRHALRYPEQLPALDMASMASLGEHCSLTERRADEATRDVAAWLKCEYMQDHIGDAFPGVITAVTAFGFFVALDDIHVEGLVHVSNLASDFYQFDNVMHVLTGSRTGISYAMGDKVEVRVAAVNLDERKIDFELLSRLGSSRRLRKPAAAVESVAGKSKKATASDKLHGKDRGKSKAKPAKERSSKKSNKSRKARSR